MKGIGTVHGGETRVFDGEFLRASLIGAGAAKLFVSFRQRLDQDGAFDEMRPAQRFLDNGYAHLFIQSRFNDWFINPETEALEAALRTLSGYRRRVSMGFSMGGYGAFRFAGALQLQHLIAVSPQVSIHPDVIPQDRRYRRHAADFDAIRGALEPNSGLQGAILFDPAGRYDKLHARHLQRLFPGMQLAPLCFGGHPASLVIGQKRRFGQVQKNLLRGKVDGRALVRLHRSCRRDSLLYWVQMAEWANGAGRIAWAEWAVEQAEALEEAAADAGGRSA